MDRALRTEALGDLIASNLDDGDIESAAAICETEPESRSCKRETEIKVAETCQSL